MKNQVSTETNEKSINEILKPYGNDLKKLHKILFPIFVEELDKVYRKYSGVLPDVYLCSLGEAIMDLYKEHEKIMEVFERSEQDESENT